MPPIDSLLFVACFTLVPLAMLALLAYRFVRWIADHRAVATLRADGWSPLAQDDRALVDALEDLHLTAPRARWFDHARYGDGEDAILIVTREIRRPASDFGERRTFAIVRRPAGGPVGTISRRAGGVMESVALGVAGALGPAPIEPPGWSWAIVGSPSPVETWPASAGAAMEPLVCPGEHVLLGARHVAIAQRERPLAELMREARERLGTIRAAMER